MYIRISITDRFNHIKPFFEREVLFLCSLLWWVSPLHLREFIYEHIIQNRDCISTLREIESQRPQDSQIRNDLL